MLTRSGERGADFSTTASASLPAVTQRWNSPRYIARRMSSKPRRGGARAVGGQVRARWPCRSRSSGRRARSSEASRLTLNRPIDASRRRVSSRAVSALHSALVEAVGGGVGGVDGRAGCGRARAAPRRSSGAQPMLSAAAAAAFASSSAGALLTERAQRGGVIDACAHRGHGVAQRWLRDGWLERAASRSGSSPAASGCARRAWRRAATGGVGLLERAHQPVELAEAAVEALAARASAAGEARRAVAIGLARFDAQRAPARAPLVERGGDAPPHLAAAGVAERGERRASGPRRAGPQAASSARRRRARRRGGAGLRQPRARRRRRGRRR